MLHEITLKHNYETYSGFDSDSHTKSFYVIPLIAAELRKARKAVGSDVNY